MNGLYRFIQLYRDHFHIVPNHTIKHGHCKIVPNHTIKHGHCKIVPNHTIKQGPLQHCTKLYN